MDTPTIVTIHLLDQYSNIAATEFVSVELSSNGSVTGSGVVSIEKGIGQRSIRNSLPQLIQLSLTSASSAGISTDSIAHVSFFSGMIHDESLLIIEKSNSTYETPDRNTE